MNLKTWTTLLFSVLGLLGLIVIAIMQTAQVGQPQDGVLIALTAVTAGAAQWLFRNGSGH